MAKADRAGTIVVYINNPDDTRPENAGFPVGWQEVDIGIIDDLIVTLTAALSIDPTRIYASGMSMGGAFTYRLACDRAGVFAAFTVMAGWMNEAPDAYSTGNFVECTPSRPVALLAAHGTADSSHICAARSGRRSASALRRVTVASPGA